LRLVGLAEVLLAEPDQHGRVAVVGGLELAAPQRDAEEGLALAQRVVDLGEFLLESDPRPLAHAKHCGDFRAGGHDLAEAFHDVQRLSVGLQLARAAAEVLFRWHVDLFTHPRPLTFARAS
jgi:hypothetical protein